MHTLREPRRLYSLLGKYSLPQRVRATLCVYVCVCGLPEFPHYTSGDLCQVSFKCQLYEV